MKTNLDCFQPATTAADIFRLGSLIVFLLTQGNTWIKSYEEAAVLTSSTLPEWLEARYSPDLVTLLSRMLSTQPEERPTAEEINKETFKNKRQKKPELISANQLDEFLGLQDQLVALLPKQSYKGKGENTVTFDQWTRWLSERVAGLRNQTGNVINVSDSIAKLSYLLDWLQDPMTGEDLAEACSLLKKIEKLAKVNDQ